MHCIRDWFNGRKLGAPLMIMEVDTKREMDENGFRDIIRMEKEREENKGLAFLGIVAIAFTILMMVLVAWNAATAQSVQPPAKVHTFWGPDGRASGRSITDTQGTTTYYDAKGVVTGRTTVDSAGNATYYDGAGNKVGTISAFK
jgi:YD repeat-containing protein